MAEHITSLETEPRRSLGGWRIGAGAALLALIVIGGTALGGEARQVALASLSALPFAVLALLAYLGGNRFNWASVVAIIWALVLVGGSAVGALGYAFGALAGDLSTGQMPNLAPGDLLRVGLVFIGCSLACVLGGLCCLPAMRRFFSRFIPINAESFVHAVALATIVALIVICFTPLLVLGAPPLLSLVTNSEGLDLTGGRDAAGQLRDLVYGLVWTIPCAIVAVGYGVRRNLADALARLGLVRPSWRQVGAGLLVAVVLVVVVQLLGTAMDMLWSGLGWPQTDDAAFGELMAFALSPLGALVIGVTAGLGEELAVRGVLQPRMGILLSNLFFTSLHAFQYSWDALLIVFLVGTVCGLVRQRSNTTTAAIVHGTYNFILVMLAVAGMGG